jgi:hypothetical protein
VDPTKENLHHLHDVRLYLFGPTGCWGRHYFHVHWAVSRGSGHETDGREYNDWRLVIPGHLALRVYTVRCHVRVEMACRVCTPLPPSSATCAYESPVEKSGLWYVQED